jgi:hypothetical protein
LVLLAAAGCGDDDGNDTGAGPRFTTSAPGSKALGSLSDSEFATLCADGNAFADKLELDPTLQDARCRWLAVVFAAFGVSEGAPDSELRASCAQAFSQCMNTTSEPMQDAPDACEPADASCTATVAEYTQCINDGVAQTVALGASVPACTDLTRADLEKIDIGFQSAQADSPASCQIVEAKCSGVADGAQAFIDAYCELVDSCCTASGREGNCERRALFGAQDGTYDADAAAACLAELRQRQGEADYCATLAATDAEHAWAVSAQCARVFVAAGAGAPGEECEEDADCVPGVNGGARCSFSSSSAGVGGFARIGLQTSSVPGDAPCVGTTSQRSGTTSYAADGEIGVLCDSDEGVVCDETSRRCTQPALGAACEIEDDCAAKSSYCDFDSGTCAARLPLGAPCTGTTLVECAGNAHCPETMKVCTAPGAAGAACTSDSVVPQCAGYCDAGTCSDPLATLCF